MNARMNRAVGAVLWGILLAVILIGIAHALAIMLPDYYSARSGKQPSEAEKVAAAYSSFWLAHVSWIAPLSVALCCAITFTLAGRRRPSTAATPAPASAAAPSTNPEI
jgi:hypothetical protein